MKIFGCQDFCKYQHLRVKIPCFEAGDRVRVCTMGNGPAEFVT